MLPSKARTLHLHRSRPIFNATLGAAASWLFFLRRGGSFELRVMGTCPGSRTRLCRTCPGHATRLAKRTE